ncbi:MAG TPA: dihydrolipoamide acetyltransferase family protein [bacterium]|nr:dihydrolipoamide acetyltransferase family protein [bacterium]
MAEVIMPKMGDAMTEGKVLKWRKRPGDPVAKGEALAEIETDKVNVDIEAEEAGVLLTILVPEGQTVAVGTNIAVIGAPGQKVTPAAAPGPSPAAKATTPAPPPSAPARPSASPLSRTDVADRVKASPLARNLALEHGIDLTTVHGTGPDGRITKEDVEALIATAARPTPTAPPAPGAEGEFEAIPLTKMRQTIAKRMSQSKQQAAHFYVTVEVDMDAALRARQQLNAAQTGGKLSVNDLVVKAAALALRQYPNLNSALIEGTIRRYKRINVAIAVALPEGLIAPVVHDTDRLSLAEVAGKIHDLGERARAGHLHPEDYNGGTFTVSNLGMFGDVDNFIAIINPPQTAILAVGKALPHAVVRKGQIVAAIMMKLTLSADHRVTDGAEAAQYLQELKRLLETPDLVVREKPAS